MRQREALSQVNKSIHESYVSCVGKNVSLQGAVSGTQRVGGFCNFHSFPGPQDLGKIQHCQNAKN